MKLDRRPPTPERELSLIERAGAVYGFGNVFRDPAAPAPAPAVDRAPDPLPAPPPETPAGDKPDWMAALETPPGTAQPAPVAAPAPAPEPATPVAEAASEPATPVFEAAPPLDLAAISRATFEAAAAAQLEEWVVPEGIQRIDRAMLAEKGMLVPGAPIGALAEEFRLVKRQLLLGARAIADAGDPQRARLILVGSGKPGDGKTYCAINLAISLAAERDVEIVLVDADFAKPDVMATLGADDSAGLLDILGDPALDPEDCIVRTDVPQLSLLPAGKRTHADTELLASRRTGEVIERLLAANPKRIIVFDTPPTLAASPASVLASLVGQVMLVVRADRTTEADVRQAVALLDGCDSINLVLNAVSYQPGGGRFGSYYGQEK
jgi:exopolysaccharide/PEP-CTERM locus tyrosine autokinase